MPYIKPGRRNEIGRGLTPCNAGELAYALTRVVKRYLDLKGRSFDTIADIRGALDSTTDEFRRQVQDPYEDQKIIDNGRIYK